MHSDLHGMLVQAVGAVEVSRLLWGLAVLDKLSKTAAASLYNKLAQVPLNSFTAESLDQILQVCPITICPLHFCALKMPWPSPALCLCCACAAGQSRRHAALFPVPPFLCTLRTPMLLPDPVVMHSWWRSQHAGAERSCVGRWMHSWSAVSAV